MMQELPQSWCYVPLSDVVEINPGIDKSKFSDADELPFVPMPAVEAGTGRIDTSERRPFGKVKSGFTTFATGDVVFAKITPCMENGKMAVVPPLPQGVGFGTTEFHVLRSTGVVDAKFVYYFVSSAPVRHDAQHHMTGAVGQKRVPKRYLETKRFPLAPLGEQHRIVEKIETLFAQLDKGEEALREVQKLLARYRQSVLKAAVTGQLTADWRAENAHCLEHGRDLLVRILQARRGAWKGRKKYKEPVAPDARELPALPEGWVWVSTEQLAFVETGATPRRGNLCYYDNGSVPWVTSTAVNEPIVIEPQDYITEAALKETNTKVFPAGTLIVALYGEGKTRGKIAELGIDAATNQACAALLISHLTTTVSALLKRFYEYNYEAIRLASSGGVQPNLNLGIVKSTLLPLPPESEAKEILDRLDIELHRLQVMKEYCETELARSTSLRQSILKDGFEGRLVSQDPADEPAGALLARIRECRAAARERTTCRARS